MNLLMPKGSSTITSRGVGGRCPILEGGRGSNQPIAWSKKQERMLGVLTTTIEIPGLA
jgi:hypothetical protein